MTALQDQISILTPAGVFWEARWEAGRRGVCVGAAVGRDDSIFLV